MSEEHGETYICESIHEDERSVVKEGFMIKKDTDGH